MVFLEVGDGNAKNQFATEIACDESDTIEINKDLLIESNGDPLKQI